MLDSVPFQATEGGWGEGGGWRDSKRSSCQRAFSLGSQRKIRGAQKESGSEVKYEIPTEQGRAAAGRSEVRALEASVPPTKIPGSSAAEARPF